MVTTRERLVRVLQNLATSGMGEEYGVETLRRVMLLNFIMFTCLVFIIPLGIAAHLQGNAVLGIADHVVALVMVANFFYVRATRDYKAGSLIGLTFIMVLFLFLLANGGVNNTAHVWYFTFPLAASFLAGARQGAIASSILLVFAVVFFALDIQSEYLASYPAEFPLRFIPAYIVVFAFSYVFEASRESASTLLEHRVAERTQELSVANAELTREIANRQRAEEEQRLLEEQLARSQKMEAVGLLAGGVAHDLNNVLSAVVGYPELVLRELPEDSELREPVALVKSSGEQAAAIVQDLLTLARRGVVTRRPMDLNEVVQAYMSSAACRKLAQLHGEVDVQTDLAQGLPGLVGSPIHLTKVIMNLVGNAAEAMADGGTVRICTRLERVDEPRMGYEQILAGSYLILEVSDTGTGISSEDLSRIFEPFFTRKQLGCSGSGLGMAVVWGVVKDHDGFIDVRSELGRGTAVTVYLPASDQIVVPAPEEASCLDDIMGRGESILVVDDLDLQRRLADRMLTRLGYEVAVQPSGEEAIRYLEENTADLVVLDMIMDDGLDGLETYEEIRKRNPDQKAVIVSGFSATDRVRAAQLAGAGRYLRKPYTLEQIGGLVRSELDRERGDEA